MPKAQTFAVALLLAAPAAAAQIQCVSGSDNAPAINAALASSSVALTGDCSTASAIHLTGSYTLSGTATIRALTPDAFNLIEVGIQGSTKPVTGWSVQDLTLSGAATSGDPVANHSDGIVVWGDASGGSINGVRVYSDGDSGISIFAPRIVVSNSTVAFNWHNGIMITGTAQGPADSDTLTGNLVTNNSLQVAPIAAQIVATGVKSWDEIDFESGHSNARVTGNQIFGDVLLRQVTPANTQTAPGDVIDSNTFVGSQVSGVIVTGLVTSFTVSNNDFWDCTNYAVNIGGGGPSNGSITGNRLHGGGPVVVHKSATNIVLTANTQE